MAQDTLVIYKDDTKGFWITESQLQVVLHYILQELKLPKYSFSNKAHIIDDFEFIINGYMHSYLYLSLADLLDDTIKAQEFVRVLQQVKLNFRFKDEFISVAELLAIPTEDDSFREVFGYWPYSKFEVILIIDALNELITGTWNRGIENFDLNF
jgi:hypothetical protein